MSQSRKNQPFIPEGWTAQFDKEYQTWFFINLSNGNSQWEPPNGTSWKFGSANASDPNEPPAYDEVVNDNKNGKQVQTQTQQQQYPQQQFQQQYPQQPYIQQQYPQQPYIQQQYPQQQPYYQQQNTQGKSSGRNNALYGGLAGAGVGLVGGALLSNALTPHYYDGYGPGFDGGYGPGYDGGLDGGFDCGFDGGF
ncbi:hypothetical protein TPHA_0D00570 [Tetrapisispora phaffii CBS 4417]|uniref:WW domain-containing protein n=1 Tax=Tetrapisispora phaffii (strain ATCC 24235 / CBS 4417 / NBRC 1672 / NRRL Y-8282 / UCD 70-5) TaxID=1071381 RepID=G8BS80_TETPH|nr:hypothetical protein TPHA_0D00570 [Tetrapisispora phaffii CBS 4417]CCE62701.1 hypothetical protein TPHA_0D00570 [Tetrapisispora phaffii CBS 4417]